MPRKVKWPPESDDPTFAIGDLVWLDMYTSNVPVIIAEDRGVFGEERNRIYRVTSADENVPEQSSFEALARHMRPRRKGQQPPPARGARPTPLERRRPSTATNR